MEPAGPCPARPSHCSCDLVLCEADSSFDQPLFRTLGRCFIPPLVDASPRHAPSIALMASHCWSTLLRLVDVRRRSTSRYTTRSPWPRPCRRLWWSDSRGSCPHSEHQTRVRTSDLARGSRTEQTPSLLKSRFSGVCKSAARRGWSRPLARARALAKRRPVFRQRGLEGEGSWCGSPCCKQVLCCMHKLFGASPSSNTIGSIHT